MMERKKLRKLRKLILLRYSLPKLKSSILGTYISFSVGAFFVVPVITILTDNFHFFLIAGFITIFFGMLSIFPIYAFLTHATYYIDAKLKYHAVEFGYNIAKEKNYLEKLKNKIDRMLTGDSNSEAQVQPVFTQDELKRIKKLFLNTQIRPAFFNMIFALMMVLIEYLGIPILFVCFALGSGIETTHMATAHTVDHTLRTLLLAYLASFFVFLPLSFFSVSGLIPIYGILRLIFYYGTGIALIDWMRRTEYDRMIEDKINAFLDS